MSMKHLMDSAVTLMRTTLEIPENQCGKKILGRPSASCGQVYYAVHQGTWTNQDDLCLEELMGLQITITMRLPVRPQDKLGDTIGTEIEVLAERIALFFHMNYDHINAANTLIGAESNGFVEPLKFRNCTIPEVKTAEWFWSDQEGLAGVAITINFDGAKRVRTLANLPEEI